MTTLTIRPMAASEAPVLAAIFHRAVQDGAAPRYTAAERRAWSPAPPDGKDWALRLMRGITMVADRGAGPVGFMTLDLSAGYLDLAYILPEERGRGVADAIYAVIEGRARAEGLDALSCDASLMAEPFLRRQG